VPKRSLFSYLQSRGTKIGRTWQDMNCMQVRDGYAENVILMSNLRRRSEVTPIGSDMVSLFSCGWHLVLSLHRALMLASCLCLRFAACRGGALGRVPIRSHSTHSIFFLQQHYDLSGVRSIVIAWKLVLVAKVGLQYSTTTSSNDALTVLCAPFMYHAFYRNYALLPRWVLIM
jgi:hypothetical protein